MKIKIFFIISLYFVSLIEAAENNPSQAAPALIAFKDTRVSLEAVLKTFKDDLNPVTLQEHTIEQKIRSYEEKQIKMLSLWSKFVRVRYQSDYQTESDLRWIIDNGLWLECEINTLAKSTHELYHKNKASLINPL